MCNSSHPLHIFFFPFLAQGHIIPMVDMAKLFASKGVKATIINAPLISKAIEKSILIVRVWAPQVLILEHEAIGSFVTHCGWNSTLEGVAAGVPLVTWPVSAEQFYNENLVTDVLKIGVPVGVKKWGTFAGDSSIKWDAIDKVVKKIMTKEEAVEEMRNKAKMFSWMARQAMEEGGSSYTDLNALIDELGSLPW